MVRLHLLRRFTAVFAAIAALALVFAGSAGATPTAATDINFKDAALGLRAAATGNPEAEAAMDRLLASPMTVAKQNVALPGQVFQVPAFSDTGRLDPATGGLYGSGIALGLDGFRFGFFGGPATISPNQGGAQLNVIWLNLANGKSGTEVLNEHADIPVDTSIRTKVLNPGGGPIVAAVYGSLWHRWAVPVDDQHKDGFAYVKSTINFPSLGAVLG